MADLLFGSAHPLTFCNGSLKEVYLRDFEPFKVGLGLRKVEHNRYSGNIFLATTTIGHSENYPMSPTKDSQSSSFSPNGSQATFFTHAFNRQASKKLGRDP